QQHRVMGQPAAHPEDLGEDEEEDAEEDQRPHHRPEVAEDGAEVGPFELGHGHQPEEVEEATAAAAERRRPSDLAERFRLGGAGGGHWLRRSATTVATVWGISTMLLRATPPKTWKSSARSMCNTVARGSGWRLMPACT